MANIFLYSRRIVRGKIDILESDIVIVDQINHGKLFTFELKPKVSCDSKTRTVFGAEDYQSLLYWLVSFDDCQKQAELLASAPPQKQSVAQPIEEKPEQAVKADVPVVKADVAQVKAVVPIMKAADVPAVKPPITPFNPAAAVAEAARKKAEAAEARAAKAQDSDKNIVENKISGDNSVQSTQSQIVEKNNKADFVKKAGEEAPKKKGSIAANAAMLAANFARIRGESPVTSTPDKQDASESEERKEDSSIATLSRQASITVKPFANADLVEATVNNATPVRGGHDEEKNRRDESRDEEVPQRGIHKGVSAPSIITLFKRVDDSLVANPPPPGYVEGNSNHNNLASHGPASSLTVDIPEVPSKPVNPLDREIPSLEVFVKRVKYPAERLARRIKIWYCSSGFSLSSEAEIEQFVSELQQTEDEILLSFAKEKFENILDWANLLELLRKYEAKHLIDNPVKADDITQAVTLSVDAALPSKPDKLIGFDFDDDEDAMEMFVEKVKLFAQFSVSTYTFDYGFGRFLLILD